MVFQIREIRNFLNFGAYMIGNNLVNTFSYQVDVLLGAKILGAQSIGTYSLTKEFSIGVSRLFNPIITRVGTPMMAKAQDDEALMKKVYLQTMRMTASVNFPIYIAMGVFAPEVVNLVFGEKWIDAIPLLQIFAAWGLFRSTANPVGSLLIARGRADLSFKWNLSLFLVVTPMVWAGSLWGTNGLALSSLVFMIAIFIPNWYFLVKPLCGAGFREYIKQFIPPLLASIVASVVAYSAAYWFISNIVRLCIGLLVGALIYLGLSSRINREWLVPMQTLLWHKS
jgi:lipopolysaccharide exporter